MKLLISKMDGSADIEKEIIRTCQLFEVIAKNSNLNEMSKNHIENKWLCRLKENIIECNKCKHAKGKNLKQKVETRPKKINDSELNKHKNAKNNKNEKSMRQGKLFEEIKLMPFHVKPSTQKDDKAIYKKDVKKVGLPSD